MGRGGSARGVAALYRSPETVNTPPVANRAAGEMSQAAAFATSSGAPMRREGVAASIRSRKGASASCASAMSVAIILGATAFTPDSLRADLGCEPPGEGFDRALGRRVGRKSRQAANPRRAIDDRLTIAPRPAMPGRKPSTAFLHAKILT